MKELSQTCGKRIALSQKVSPAQSSSKILFSPELLLREVRNKLSDIQG